MIVQKHLILTAVAILGACFIAIGAAMMVQGIASATNASLQILGLDQGLCYFCVYTGGALITISGIGWVAGQTKLNYLAFAYGSLSMFMALLFSAIAITFLVAKGQVDDNIAYGCKSETGFYNDIDEIYSKGSSILCTEKCPCIGVEGVTDQFGASTLLECPGTRAFYTPAMEARYSKWLTVFESQLHCAGMCTEVGYYLFIGTDQGQPTQSCQAAIAQLVEEEAGRYAGWCSLFSFVGGMAAVAAVAMFYVERKKFVPSYFDDLGK